MTICRSAVLRSGTLATAALKRADSVIGAPTSPLPSAHYRRINSCRMKPLDFSHELNRLMDPYWRKARIAARLLIKREDGLPWSARDRRLAERIANHSSVTNRLLDQGYFSHRARKRNGRSILDIIP